MFSRREVHRRLTAPCDGTRSLLLAAIAAAGLGCGSPMCGAARAEPPEIRFGLPFATQNRAAKANGPDGASGEAAAPDASLIEAAKIILTGDAKRTRFGLELSKGVTAEVATLADPYRVIVDLPNVSFRGVEGTAPRRKGLVRAFRYGMFAEGKSRVVLDVTGPVRVEKAEMEPVETGSRVRLLLTLAPMDKKAFGAGTGAARRAAKKPASESDARPAGTKVRGKPVVVIDPGHGGIDPGATGPSNLLEKNVVLSVAQDLGKVLEASGRYEVRFTRSTDVFVPLKERVALSRRLEADLFVSLHADAIEKAAQSVRGASVYTLSEKASDEEARLRAERENASDLLAGIDAGDGEGRDEVMSILLDLMKRESTEFSIDFANILIGKLVKSTSMSREARRGAAFTVLKQTHAPSVLVELGYMSHAEDEKLMTSPEWRRKVSYAITAAIDAYFAKRRASIK